MNRRSVLINVQGEISLLYMFANSRSLAGVIKDRAYAGLINILRMDWIFPTGIESSAADFSNLQGSPCLINKHDA